MITEILDQRVDLAQCIDTDALELAIAKTGGVLRHLFTVLQQATTAASQSAVQSERIAKAHVRYGLNRLKGDLLRRIGVMGLPEDFEGITTAQLYERLDELTGQPQRVTSDRINLLLLQAHALIEYNGDQWHRVHPLVAEHVEATRRI